jgi:NAD+ synthase (glutamine-hydrolysing)
MDAVRIALAQINPAVGDLADNVQKILDYITRAKELEADIIAFPELAVSGYPPEDLLLKTSFVAENLACLNRIAEATTDIVAIVGFVDSGDDLFNAAAVLHKNEIAGVYHKNYLPSYAVFDEDRYFMPGERPLVLMAGKTALGISICEDIWYPAGPTRAQALAGAQLAINISASPYHAGKIKARERMLATRAADNVIYVAFCNLVGGQDELVFDGGSVVFDQRGDLVARGKQFAEDLVVADLDLTAVFRQRLHDPRQRKERARQSTEIVDRIRVASPAPRRSRQPKNGSIVPHLEPVAEVYQALVLGTRDYARKNGFQRAVIGLSGGIDSALTAVVATEALGRSCVTGVFMPSRFSSVESRVDAARLAANLGIQFLTIPIDPVFRSYLDTLADTLSELGQGKSDWHELGVTEENIQARIRGNILMALSNKFGWLVLTTGNKSEMSVGYATLYGDMAGGFAVIKDVPKMLVYDIAAYINADAGRCLIPQRILDKAPTAELRPDQKDEDSLPPYDVLDPILHAYVEEDQDMDEIVAMGFNPATVTEVFQMVDRSEYKRRQAPPGVRITPRALGRDRRMPITNRYDHR